MVPVWITHWTARTPRLSCFPFVRFILRLAVIVMICPAAVLAESCLITTTLAVTDAQRSLYAARDQLSDMRRSSLAATITLFKALGGGWRKSADSQ